MTYWVRSKSHKWICQLADEALAVSQRERQNTRDFSIFGVKFSHVDCILMAFYVFSDENFSINFDYIVIHRVDYLIDENGCWLVKLLFTWLHIQTHTHTQIWARKHLGIAFHAIASNFCVSHAINEQPYTVSRVRVSRPHSPQHYEPIAHVPLRFTYCMYFRLVIRIVKLRLIIILWTICIAKPY